LVVDTNILLNLLNEDDNIESLLNRTPVYISYITEIELLSYHNISASELKKIEAMIDNCTVIEMNHDIKQHVINLRKKYRVKVNDAIIAATSLYMGMPLLTADSGFIKIKELDLKFYEK